MSLDRRPGPDEYNAYYRGYVALPPDGPIVDTLARQIEDTAKLLEGVGADRAGHRYAPGKWSVREVVGHVADAERLFIFRALWFARRDPAPLPGMEADDWAEAAGHDRRSLESLVAELRAVRAATLSLLADLDPELADARGTASGFPFTVRSLAWITAGHELHHRRILEERYLA